MEFCAAISLAKLYKKAPRAFKTINKFYLCTDFHCTDMDTGSTNKWNTSAGHNVHMIQEKPSSATCRHVPSQSNPADHIQDELSFQHEHPHHSGHDHTGQHRSHQSGLQRRLTFQQILGPQKCTCRTSTTSRRHYMKTSKLTNSTELLYCRRLNNCRHFIATRQPATLTTQDIYQALTCCVMIQ
jgi:hypothetical protein